MQTETVSWLPLPVDNAVKPKYGCSKGFSYAHMLYSNLSVEKPQTIITLTTCVNAAVRSSCVQAMITCDLMLMLAALLSYNPLDNPENWYILISSISNEGKGIFYAVYDL